MTDGPSDKKETHNLIGSDKVAGTKVYDLEGSEIGKVERVMIEKSSGRVAYAVVSFGGFMGIGDGHYPLPWEKLKYDEKLDGYHLDVSAEEIEGAPKDPGPEFDWSPEAGVRIHEYYGVLPYWPLR